jgi:hypothetical protein
MAPSKYGDGSHARYPPLIVGNSIPPANHAGRDPSGKSLQKTPASYRYMSYPPEPLAYLETNFLGEAVPVTFGCL